MALREEIAGLAALMLYIYGISMTRVSRVNLPRGLSGWDDDFTITDDAREDISPDDLSLGSPERRELTSRIREAEQKLPQSEWPADPRYKP